MTPGDLRKLAFGGVLLAGSLGLLGAEGPTRLVVTACSVFAAFFVTIAVFAREKHRLASTLAGFAWPELVEGRRIGARQAPFRRIAVAWLLIAALDVAVGQAGLGAVFGGFGALLLAITRLPGGWLRFERDGLRIGDWYGEWLIRWDEIAVVRAAVRFDQPLVLLTLDVERLLGRLRAVAPERAARVHAGIARSRERVGADWAVFVMPFGLHEEWLAKVVSRFAHEPAARAELVAP